MSCNKSIQFINKYRLKSVNRSSSNVSWRFTRNGQSKTAVNANAKPESMPKIADPGTRDGSVEDLGGPTPENYSSDDDDSFKIRVYPQG